MAAVIPGDGDLKGFVADTLKRAGLLASPSSSSSSPGDGAVEVDADAVVAQANAVVIPCRVRMPSHRSRHGSTAGEDERVHVKHLVIKHVDVSTVAYRDDEHRERTRAAYARECAFYRSGMMTREHVHETSITSTTTTTRFPAVPAVPAVYLVEGDLHETSDVFTLVMDDARFMPGDAHEDGGGGGGSVGEGGEGTSPAGMSLAEAEAAVEWLASFHARFWRGFPPPLATSSESVAPTVPEAVSRTRGGYWTLEKRPDDLEGMEAEWDKLLAAFPGEPTLEAHRWGDVSDLISSHLNSAENWRDNPVQRRRESV